MARRLGLRNKIRDLGRLREIASVIFLAGGGALLERMGLKYLVPLKCRLRYLFSPRKIENCLLHNRGDGHFISPRSLRLVLEQLGPTFVKFGQVLSLRADIVGEELSRELSRLQSDVRRMDHEDARRIIKEELGKDPDDIFIAFEREPVAAASLAQVHRAELPDGSKVAVKVQRPGIRETIERDIDILFYLAHAAEKFFPEARNYRFKRLVAEFADWTRRELDFMTEGNNADRFRYNFRDNRHIKVPRIYWDLTSERVLTMEFVDGVRPDDAAGRARIGADPEQLALHGTGAMFQQFCIDGFFHADPHPGNFSILGRDVLCMQDFGMVGYFNREQRKELVSCFVAFTDRNAEGFFKHFMHLAGISPGGDVAGYRRDVANILSLFFYSPNQPSVAWAFFRVINKGAEKGIAFPSDLAVFGRALITAEAMGLKLYPRFDLNGALRSFVDDAMKSYLDPKKAVQELRTDIFDYLELLKNIPENVRTLFAVRARSEEGLSEEDGLTAELRELDRQNDLRILGMFLSALLFAEFVYALLRGSAAFPGLPAGALLHAAFLLALASFLLKMKRRS